MRMFFAYWGFCLVVLFTQKNLFHKIKELPHYSMLTASMGEDYTAIIVFLICFFGSLFYTPYLLWFKLKKLLK